jgi:hypothetical protein
MNEKEKVIEVSEKEVKVETTDIKTEMTKGEKAFATAKKVGNGVWRAVKVTCMGVGAFVLGAITVGAAIGAACKGDNSDDIPDVVPIEPINYPKETGEISETTYENSNVIDEG